MTKTMSEQLCGSPDTLLCYVAFGRVLECHQLGNTLWKIELERQDSFAGAPLRIKREHAFLVR